MTTFNLPVTYDQLLMLAQLLNRHDVLNAYHTDAAQLRAFVRLELARANQLARQCLDCG